MFDWQFEIRACSFKLGTLGNIFAGANTENYHLRIVKKKWLSFQWDGLLSNQVFQLSYSIAVDIMDVWAFLPNNITQQQALCFLLISLVAHKCLRTKFPWFLLWPSFQLFLSIKHSVATVIISVQSFAVKFYASVLKAHNFVRDNSSFRHYPASWSMISQIRREGKIADLAMRMAAYLMPSISVTMDKAINLMDDMTLPLPSFVLACFPPSWTM